MIFLINKIWLIIKISKKKTDYLLKNGINFLKVAIKKKEEFEKSQKVIIFFFNKIYNIKLIRLF